MATVYVEIFTLAPYKTIEKAKYLPIREIAEVHLMRLGFQPGRKDGSKWHNVAKKQLATITPLLASK